MSSWWKPEYDGGWGRLKEALKRDWEQTKLDLTGPARETVPVAQEEAFRYGYGARQHYADRKWTQELEQSLRAEYDGDWERDRQHVRYCYEELYDRAGALGIENRADMSKAELYQAIQQH